MSTSRSAKLTRNPASSPRRSPHTSKPCKSITPASTFISTSADLSEKLGLTREAITPVQDVAVIYEKEGKLKEAIGVIDKICGT